MTYLLSHIAEQLGLSWEGPDVCVARPALLDDTSADSITLAGSEEFARRAAERGAAALVMPLGLASPLPVLRSSKPRIAFAHVIGLFAEQPPPRNGIHPGAFVAEDAALGADVSIGPNAVVESGACIGRGTHIAAGAFVGAGAAVGADCVIGPGARVLDRCRVGDRVRLESGAVIGSEGFGYEWDGERHVRVPHIGIAVLEDDVDIGANTTVDRGKTGETRIGRGAKIDNLVQIGHGARIGAHCLVVAQVGISGSVVVEPGAVLAGQVGVADNVTIGAGAVVAAQAGVTKDLAGGGTYMGMPARPAGEARRALAARDQVPEMLRRLRALEKKVL